MPEPHTTAGGMIVGASIGITGSVLGAQIDALLLGLVASIFVSVWIPTVNDRFKAASAVAMSSLLAGYGSPVVASWLSSEQHGFADGSPLRLLMALLIAIVTPTVIPVAVTRLQSFVASFGGGKA